MKIIIASDSFKGSLSSHEAGLQIQSGILRVFPGAQTKIIEVADGGEGSVDAVLASRSGEKVMVETDNPLGEKILSHYGNLGEGVAIFEVASASGLTTLSGRQNPGSASSYGTGMQMVDALDCGYTTLYLGLGGSATNDGGMGILHALGYRFYTKDHQLLQPCADALKDVQIIDNSNLHPHLKHAKIILLSDVQNPLLGPSGSTFTFGEQKGIDPLQLSAYDQAMESYHSCWLAHGYPDHHSTPGAGAAGGIGFGLLTGCKATLMSGIEAILDLIDFKKQIQDFDLVVTGEGQMDHQTLWGKVPLGIAKQSASQHIPTVAIVGSLLPSAKEVFDLNISAIESCVTYPQTLEKALTNAQDNLADGSERLMRALLLGQSINMKK